MSVEVPQSRPEFAMIIIDLKDPILERAVVSVAHPDEDVFPLATVGAAVFRHGYPRLVVRQTKAPVFESVRIVPGRDSDVPSLVVTAGTLARWRFERRATGVRGPEEQGFANRLEAVVAEAPRIVWIDSLFRSLERASGGALPQAFRGMARRVLEYPLYYGSLGAVADRVSLTSGALQGRFFRRSLSSPSEHLRWLRLFALANGLKDESLTVADAAARFGYTSAGNLCRSLRNTISRAPTELRDPMVMVSLYVQFAQEYLGPRQREGWKGLEDLFTGIPLAEESVA